MYNDCVGQLIEFNTKANLKSLGKHTGLKGKLSLRQKGICPICDKSLFLDHLGNTAVLNYLDLEIDHIKPISEGGSKTSQKNMRLTHKHCHQHNIHNKRIS